MKFEIFNILLLFVIKVAFLLSKLVAFVKDVDAHLLARRLHPAQKLSQSFDAQKIRDLNVVNVDVGLSQQKLTFCNFLKQKTQRIPIFVRYLVTIQ